MILYPEYNRESHAHNLALIKLSQSVKFERRISPICLPNPGKYIINNDLIDIKFNSSYIVHLSLRTLLLKCILYISGSTYLGQVGTLVGWTLSTEEDTNNNRTCRPRKLGLPILGREECIRSGINSTNFHDDSGCIGVLGGSSIVCQVY